MSEATTWAGDKSEKNARGRDDDHEALPRLLGRYVLLRMMVRGGMGEVYLATTIGIEGAERPCVVKRIRRDYRDDPSFRARFLDEARVQSQLDDPGVAKIIEASLDDGGDPFVAVEYVEGRSLADVRSRASRLSSGKRGLAWGDAVAVALEIASALAHVHERTNADGSPLEIVHRDLSPQNVMIGFGGDVKLIDFGTARGENRRCHTVSGNVLAKPGYCAPEVSKGESATARADLYALGVMLWEMVAGRRFLEGDVGDHAIAIREGSLRPASLAGKDDDAAWGDGPIPRELDRAIAWLTEPNPESRCARARDAAQTLASILSSAPRRPVEERGVRARVKALLARLYPSEPAASRVEFARLVGRARKLLASQLPTTPVKSTETKLATQTTVSEGDAGNGAHEEIPEGLPGTRYRLVRRIGEGAMGVVHEAEHVDLGRRVAIKVLQPKHSVNPEFVARFRREARAIAGLSHPNLVHVYDFGQTVEPMPRLFFAMEKLEGETLESYLAREKGVDWRDACEIAIKTCRALEAAHSAGLVHRDLKPANLFLTFGGRRPESLAEVGLKLLDFGVAKGSQDTGPLADDPNLSRAGAIFGTPETMAPEQITAGKVDARADLYALGCVLYHLVTGRPVFDAASPIMTMSMHLTEAAVPPRVAAPERGIPESVEHVILRALAKEPGERFIDATEMREALEEAAYGAFFDWQPEAVAAQQTAAKPEPKPMREEVREEAAEENAEAALQKEILAEVEPIVSSPSLGLVEEKPKIKRRRAPVVFAALAGIALLAGSAWMNRGKLEPFARRWILPIEHTHVPTASAMTPPAKAMTTPAVATIASAPMAKPSAITAQAVKLPSANLVEAEARLAANDAQGALTYARLAHAEGNANALSTWARAALAAGQNSEAHEAAQQWIAKSPDDPAAKLVDARALLAMGRADEARRRTDEVLKKDPASTEAKAVRAEIDKLVEKNNPKGKAKPAPKKGKHRLAQK